MTTQIIDFSEIDLTGGLSFNGEAIGAAHYNGERLWPFGVDLLYTGVIGGASYLPDAGAVFADTAAATPATFGGSIARVNPSGGQAINALQSSASLRPLLGRAPKDLRNRLTNTEGLATYIAGASGGSATTTTAVSPPSIAAQVFSITEDTANSVHRLFVVYPFAGTVNSVGSIYLKAAGRSRVHFGVGGGGTAQAQFDLSTGQFVGAANGVVATSVGDGWYRLSRVNNGGSIIAANIYAANDAGATTYLGDGRVAFYMTAAQFEENVSQVATPYQRVVAATDITETGVPSYPFARFDLSDDRLDTVLPQAVTGDVVIAGRNGSVIAPHSYAANTTFQLGPTSYTGGTPGILRAIGDVVGWSVLNKTLTAAERERLMRFYKRRGAKGLLVTGTGLELVTNGGFDTDTDWTKGTGWTIAGGVATKAAGTAAGLDQAETLIAGAAYLLTYTVTLTAGTLTPQFIGGTTQGGVSVNASGGYSQVLLAVTGSATLRFQADSAFAGTLDAVSLRRIRPEEEW